MSAGAKTTSSNEPGKELETSALSDQDTKAQLCGVRDYAANIVDTVHEPLLVLDGQLRVEAASCSFYETFGVTPEATVGQFLYDLGNNEWDIPALRQLLEDVLPQHSEFRNFEVVHDFSSLGRRVMLLNGRRLLSSLNETQTDCVLLAIEDVTERMRIQDDLVRSNEDLQRFSYVAAHDLQAPVNAALRSLQLFTRHAEERLDKKDLELLAQSVGSIERLRALMRDLLVWTDAGSAPQQRKLIAMQEPLEIALTNLQHHIIENDARVTVSELPTLPADRTQVALVFQNLIGNAIKYRREETPEIQVKATQEGESWLFSIADNGQGFEPKYAARIFEPFKRLHGLNVPGSGIGLATCKRTIERLGGKIWVESVPGQGSTFYFTLPERKKQQL